MQTFRQLLIQNSVAASQVREADALLDQRLHEEYTLTRSDMASEIPSLAARRRSHASLRSRSALHRGTRRKQRVRLSVCINLWSQVVSRACIIVGLGVFGLLRVVHTCGVEDGRLKLHAFVD